MFTDTIKVYSKSFIKSLNIDFSIHEFTYDYSIQYSDIGNHIYNVYPQWNLKINLQSLPNKTFRYKAIFDSKTFDGGYGYLTNNGFQRILYSDNGPSYPACKNDSPEGSICYIQGALEREGIFTTDSEGKFSFIITACEPYKYPYHFTVGRFVIESSVSDNNFTVPFDFSS